MAKKIRKTKTELKSQRDALQRFEKYLPTLELKKQQLRVEISRMNSRIMQKEQEQREFRRNLEEWIGLFGDDIEFEKLLRLETVDIGKDNVAGVAVPVLEKVAFKREPVDLFLSPAWIDDGLDAIETLTRMEIELGILRNARHRLEEELRITSQRVNLFEKIRIPQCKENIRAIMIALGDEQAAAVSRAKIAKRKTMEMETSTA